MIGAIIALIAGIIQAASVHIGMLITGRIIGGFAVGIMSEWKRDPKQLLSANSSQT